MRKVFHIEGSSLLLAARPIGLLSKPYWWIVFLCKYLEIDLVRCVSIAKKWRFETKGNIAEFLKWRRGLQFRVVDLQSLRPDQVIADPQYSCNQTWDHQIIKNSSEYADIIRSRACVTCGLLQGGLGCRGRAIRIAGIVLHDSAGNSYVLRCGQRSNVNGFRLIGGSNE